MPRQTINDDGTVEFAIEAPLKGIWKHRSPLATQPQQAIDLDNVALVGDLLTAQVGDSKFISTAWGASSDKILLLADRRIAGSDPVTIIATDAGEVYYWSGAAWVMLRKGLSEAGQWWSQQQYGTDLFVANTNDGVYRYDGTSFLPIGAKLITACDTTTDWSNATQDTSDFREGTASNKVQSANPGASSVLTYNPSAAIDTSTGRLSARTYALTKAAGTDCYHFKVKFSNGSGSTITAATTTFVVTDTGSKTLTWAATLWYADRSKSAAISLTSDSWQDAYCFPADATESATFNPAIVDKLEWKVTTSSGQTYMLIDDVYSIYVSTMPNVQYLAEWRNILFGGYTTAAPDSIYWSKVRAPDEWTALAIAPIKAGGDKVTALASFFHQLTIGTDHHVHTLSGSIIGQTYPAYLFDINEVTDECGISSHRSVVKSGNQLFWFYQTNIFSYKGTAVEKVSYAIDPLLATIDLTNLQATVGRRYRPTNEIWWTWRRSGQSANDRVLRWHTVYEGFLTSTLTTPLIGVTYSSGAEKLLTVDETNRFIYAENDTTVYTRFGANLVTTIELPALGLPGLALEWQEAQLAYLSNTGTLTVGYRLADHLRALSGTSYTTIDTVNTAATDEYGRIRLGYQGKVFQLKLTITAQALELQFPIMVRARVLGGERTFP